jgi:hypothetical protein
MSDDRKPVWPWIVALMIGLPVLYVASFGPAGWLVNHVFGPEWLKNALVVIYMPIIWIDKHGPAPVHEALRWFDHIWR